MLGIATYSITIIVVGTHICSKGKVIQHPNSTIQHPPALKRCKPRHLHILFSISKHAVSLRYNSRSAFDFAFSSVAFFKADLEIDLFRI